MMQACHKLIASVAKAAAEEYYESLMGSSNQIWEEWKRQNPNLSAQALERRFIKRMWPNCIEFARGTLAHMLSLKTVSPEAKAEIYEALQLDRSLLVGMPKQEALRIIDREIMKKQEGRLH